MMNQKRTRNKIDICAYCEKSRPLCMSHAIPDAFFRDMFKQGDGQAMRNTTGRASGRSQESGKCRLMCADCEAAFNVRFDKNGTRFINEFRREINEKRVRSAQIHNWELIEFAISIFWRAALSSSDKYRGFVLTDSKTALLKSVLKNRNSSALKRIAIRFRNIIDDEGFLEPNMMLADAGTMWKIEPEENCVWLALLINGFYIELEMPGPKVHAASQGYLAPHQRTLEIVDVGLWTDPMLSESCRNMLDDHLNGNVAKGHYQASLKYHQQLSSDPERQKEIDSLGQAMAAAERNGGSPSEVLKRFMNKGWAEKEIIRRIDVTK
jgi:hypothetical protein